MTLKWFYHQDDKKHCWKEPACLVCYFKCFFWLLSRMIGKQLRGEQKKEPEGGRQRIIVEAICPFSDYCPYIDTQEGCEECVRFIEGKYIERLSHKAKDHQVEDRSG